MHKSWVHFINLYGTATYCVWPPVAKYTILRVLGKLAKLRQATVSFVAPVCPSAWDKSSPIGHFAMQLDMSNFRKQVQKIQILLKSDKNNGHFTWRPTDIYGNIRLNASQKEKRFRQKLCRESKHTFMVNLSFFFRKSCHLWAKVEKYSTAGTVTITIWFMLFACLVPTFTDTHSEYGMRIAFPLQQWLHECASMLRHTYTARLVMYLTLHLTVDW